MQGVTRKKFETKCATLRLEKRVELTTIVLVTSSHAPFQSMWPVSPKPITPIGSTTSLSEHVQLNSAKQMPNKHQVSGET
ncbi:hypothetical protein TNCV_283071 [Trichonephila clavipes]|nr:hypothetical protein TNCV_283071 [Trichonephila clavipes]